MPKTTKPVIFSLLDTPAFGGAEQYLLAQLQHLAQQGFPVVVATNNTQVASIYRDTAAKSKLHSFQIIHAPYRLDAIGDWKGLIKFWLILPGALVWCFITLQQLRRKYGAVICYWPGWSDRLVFSPLAKLLKAKLIWIEIGPLEPLFVRNFGFPKLLHRLMHTLPDKVVTTSDWTQKSMAHIGLIPFSKMTLIYPSLAPVPDTQLAWYKNAAVTHLQGLHLDGKTLISWVGRMARENELELLLEAITKLPTTVHLIAIGGGPELNYYQQLAAQLGIASRVHFVGFVSETEKKSLVAASQLFVFTRAWDLDGFGMTSIEAMNLGVPTISSRFGPQLEVIHHGVTGWQFEPHSSSSLTKILRSCLKTPIPTRATIAAAGRHFVASKFALKPSLKQLEIVLQ